MKIKNFFKRLWQWILNRTVIDEKINYLVEEVDERIERISEEIDDVQDAVKEVANQATDVVDAAKGSKRRGRKPAKMTKSYLRTLSKEELIELARKKYKAKLDVSLNKTTLINKVYEIAHTK